MSEIKPKRSQCDVLEHHVSTTRCAELDRQHLERQTLVLVRTDRRRPPVVVTRGANGDEARAAAYDNGFEFIKDRANAPVHPLGQNVSMYHCIGFNDRADDDIKFALPAARTW